MAYSTLHQRQLVRDSIDLMNTQMPTVCTRFFTILFRLDPSQTIVFDGNAVFLNRKFASMMATFKNVGRLEDMAEAIESLSCRHVRYGMELIHLEPFKEALMQALEESLADAFTDELHIAWQQVYDDVIAIMVGAVEKHPEWQKDHKKFHDSHHDSGLLEAIGGAEMVTTVHQCFYDKMFDDAWVGQFFLGKHKPGIIRKQSEFMVAAFGGPNEYSGEPPALVHMHMYITEEMALYREKMLRQSILECGLDATVADRWLAVDRSFWPSVNKEKLSECVTTCPGQMPITIKK